MTRHAGDAGAGAPAPTGTLPGSPDDQPAGLPAAGPLLPMDPRQLGAYHLLGRLGEGGMGTVFLARDAGGRPVAIKVIRAEYARDEQFRTRFRREAEAARRVARFCTAQVLDVGLEGEAAYLVTEFIDGPTLSAWIAQDGPLRGSMLDSLAIGVAAALNGIHAAGVVHRDLKASNVLLSRLGPKVIDFGIARALAGPVARTDSGPVIGTPTYMAPEQFDGKITAASDVFAWGCVVVYAGTGRTPFGTGTPYELMRRVTTGEPDLSGLEPPLRDLVARALLKRPEQRPSARDLLLTLVGDADDPVRATTEVLDAATWTLPPAPAPPSPPDGTLPDVAPTRVDAPPTLVDERPARRRAARWLPRVGAAATVAALTLVAALLLVPDQDPARNGADPGGTPSATAGSNPAPTKDEATAPAGPAASGGTDARRIILDARVPQTGTATLGVGEVHTYRFVLTDGGPVYLQSVAEDCGSHLLPWTLARRGGAVITRAQLTCKRYGPLPLDAGEYELRVGGPGVEGRYALRLIRG